MCSVQLPASNLVSALATRFAQRADRPKGVDAANVQCKFKRDGGEDFPLISKDI